MLTPENFLRVLALLGIPCPFPTDTSLFVLKFFTPQHPLEAAIFDDPVVSERVEKMQKESYDADDCEWADVGSLEIVEQMTPQERVELRARVIGR